MTIERFWGIIEQAGESVETYDEQANNITELLETLEPKEIISFHEQLYLRLYEAYRWDLWAVADIIYGGGCSDDAFEDFRCWLIAQGRNFFEAVLQAPEKAAERVKDGEDVDFEPLLAIALYAYETRTGQEMPLLDLVEPEEPQGESWKGDDLKRLYPDLCARFFGS